MKQILFAILIFFSFQCFAQDLSWKAKMNDPNYNFYEVCQQAEAYFATINIKEKGSGWKPYQRWKEQNEYRYYPSGDRNNIRPDFATEQYQLFLKNNPINTKLFVNGWNELGPYTIDSISGHYSAGLGRVEDFYVDPNNPNTIYQSSRSGGFWKSNDGGLSWTGSSTDFLAATGVNVIAVSPTNPDSILINIRNAGNSYSHGVYRSTDGGNTWALSNFNPNNIGQGGLGDNFQVYALYYHPLVPNKILIGTNEGLYISNDNLQTWTHSLTSSDITEIAFHTTNPDIIYCYNGYYYSNNKNQILVSNDGGNSFSYTTNLTNNNNNRNILFSTSPICDSCLWVASNNGVWLSTDEGQTFDYRSAPPQSSHGFAVCPNDTSILLHGYVDIAKSNNGGNSFFQVTYWSLGNTNGAGNGHQTSYQTSTDYVHADVRNMRYVGNTVYVATDGFLSASNDNGDTWINIGDGIGIRENYCLGQSQSNHYITACGSQDNGSSISLENGWLEFFGADGMEAVIHPLNFNWMVMSYQYGGRNITRDGGLTSTGFNPSVSNGDWIAPLIIDPNNHFNIYDFTDSIMLSVDENAFTYVGKPSFNLNIDRAAIAENNSQIMIVSRQQYIEKSINGGATFTNIKNNLPNYSIEDIAFDPNNDNVIIVVYAHYQNDGKKVFKSLDGGSTWTNITYNLGSIPIRSVVIDHTNASNIYLGAEIGVYTMPLNANSWSLYNTNLPNVTIKDLEICWATNTLKAASWGRGLWEYHLVDREDYPAIIKTEITNTPTNYTPKESVDQYVSSIISYDTSLTNVFIKWSANNLNFNNVLHMNNIHDSTWKSQGPLPNLNEGSLLYFKVFAVGSRGDTTETYKFMYKVRPYEPCIANGTTSSGDLYINQVNLENISNSSGNDNYSSYNINTELEKDSTYTITVNGNTGWSSNDYGAWIDFNKNMSFEANEQILFAIGTGASASQSFTVPSYVLDLDTVCLRIRLSYWGENPEPCGETFGEVEDYQIILRSDSSNSSLDSQSEEINIFHIFPNPSNGELQISCDENINYDLTIRTINGKTVYSENDINKSQNNLFINQANGLYVIEIQTDKKRYFFKWIKQ